MSDKQQTLGFFLDSWDGLFSEKNMLLLKKTCCERGMNLIVINTTSYGTQEEAINQAVVTQGLINRNNLDGLIINPGSMINTMGTAFYEQSLEKWARVPLVMVSIKIGKAPAILIDNQAGVIEAVEHLVQTHGIREIAFIRGPVNNIEAEERFAAYRKGLQRMGIDYNPDLVISGDFQWKTGNRIAEEMLLNKKIPAAIISANDLMAMDCAEILLDNGVKIPEDIAIIGFDDIDDAEIFKVPLTTVRQPYEEILIKAVDLLDRIVRCNENPPDVVFPTRFISRASCGCMPESVELMSAQSVQDGCVPNAELFIKHGLTNSAAQWFATLPSRVTHILSNQDGEEPLLMEIHTILTNKENSPVISEPWQIAVSIVRSLVWGDDLTVEQINRLGRFFEKVRILISQQVELDKRQAEREHFWERMSVRRRMQTLSSRVTLEELVEVLPNILKRITIENCFIYLFQEPLPYYPNKGWALPSTIQKVFAYRNYQKQHIEEGLKIIQTGSLISDAVSNLNKTESLMLCTLYFRDIQYGFILMNHIDIEFSTYDYFRVTIGTTLNGIFAMKARRDAEQRLKELDKAKTNFFANISHELRTPLTLISSPMESLLSGEYGEKLGYDHPMFESVYRNSLRLLKLINSLLDFSKMDAGRMGLKPKKTNISALLRFYKETIESAAKSRGLTVDYIDHTDGLVAFVDRDLLEKAVFNLLSNALKFTAAGGSITIVLDEQPDNRFAIAINDTGIGIPEDKLGAIFERFVQVDGSSSRKYEGTGIGLAFVKEIAGHMGGFINAKSREGQGSSFVLCLPSGKQGQETLEEEVEDIDEVKSFLMADLEASKASLVENTLSSKTQASPLVLVVDDNKDLLDFISSIVAKEYRIETAVNGRLGLDKALKLRPDIIVSDVMMPEMDGYQLAREVKHSEALSGVPIILLTAKADISMKIEGLERGADDYLSKPFNSRELLARIKALLEMKKLRDILAEKKGLLEALVKEQTKTIEEEKDHALALQKKAEKQLEDFLLVLASVIETKDAYTGGHVERVAVYSREIARKLGLSEREVLSIYLGAIVHDVGKIGIRDAVLNKPGKLDADEYLHMQEHPEMGSRILSKIQDIETAVEIARCHQERWDGKGYPQGLSGETIPLSARIVTIADYWDSITTDRPYRKAMPREQALEVMKSERGMAFDPAIYDVFMNEKDALYRLFETAPLR